MKAKRLDRALKLLNISVVAIKEGRANHQQDNVLNATRSGERFDQLQLTLAGCQLPDDADNRLRLAQAQRATNLFPLFCISLKTFEIAGVMNHPYWHASF